MERASIRRLDWLKKIEFEDLLKGDDLLIAKTCGIDILIRLWEKLIGIHIYISGKSIRKAQKRYIEKFYNGRNAKEIAKYIRDK